MMIGYSLSFSTPVQRSRSRAVDPEANKSSAIIMMSWLGGTPRKSHWAKYTSSKPPAGPGAVVWRNCIGYCVLYNNIDYIRDLFIAGRDLMR